MGTWLSETCREVEINIPRSNVHLVGFTWKRLYKDGLSTKHKILIMGLMKTDSEYANVISLTQSWKGSINVLVNKQISLASTELRLYVKETFPIIHNNALCYHLSTRSASKPLNTTELQISPLRYGSREFQMSSVSSLKSTFQITVASKYLNKCTNESFYYNFSVISYSTI